MHLTRIMSALTVAATLAVLGCVVVAEPATASAAPGIDDFYRAPDGFESAEPGTILRERPVELASYSELPFNAQAWQLLYRTSDLDERPTVTVTTVIAPAGPPPPDGRALLSYQVAHDSIDPACGPSVTMRAGSGPAGLVTQGEMTFIDHALQQGWAVSVPDHEGPAARIGSPREPGYAVLDGIRAAEQFPALGLSGTGTPISMWGYSGGGLATGWAAQMHPTYAPELNLRGAALGSPVPDSGAVDELGGTFWSGIQMLTLAGARERYPDVAREIDARLTSEGQASLDALSGQCLAQVIPASAFRGTAATLTVPYSELAAIPVVAAAIEESKLGSTPPTAPVYVYSGVHDEIVPIGTVDDFVSGYCDRGTPVTYRRDETSLHATLMITGGADALNWLRDRISGVPAAPGCDIRTVTSTLQLPGAAQTYATTNIGVLGTLAGLPVGPR